MGRDLSKIVSSARIAIYKGMYFVLNILEAVRFQESDDAPRVRMRSFVLCRDSLSKISLRLTSKNKRLGKVTCRGVSLTCICLRHSVEPRNVRTEGCMSPGCEGAHDGGDEVLHDSMGLCMGLLSQGDLGCSLT